MLSCPYKEYLGVECPGCGGQRSFLLLLEGNLYESIIMFPALIPLIFVFAYLILHLIFKFKNGAKVLTISFIFSAILVVGNYIMKQLV